MQDRNDNERPRLSRRARLVRQVTSIYMSRRDPAAIEWSTARAQLDFFAGLAPSAAGVTTEVTEIAGLKANSMQTQSPAAGKVLLYWHGGAYVMGSCRSHRALVSHLAKATGVRAILPEYRLAPENPFPAAVEDALAVYRSLLREGYGASDIAVAGDSAGGGLTVAMLLALRDAGEPLPAAVALMSPWLDLAGEGESMQTHCERDPWFNPQDLPHVVRHYCKPEQLHEPLVSPIFGELSGMPPCLIQVGDDEILLSDSERLAQKIIAGGGQAELDIWPGMWHVWQMFIGLMPESRSAIEKMGGFVRGALKLESAAK